MEKVFFEPKFWLLEPFPAYLNIWVFKSNHAKGEGAYSSTQLHPSGITLRLILSGEWRINIFGVNARAGAGDIFLCLPSERIEFSQIADESWEWFEIQVMGTAANDFAALFGFGPSMPVLKPRNTVALRGLFKKIHERINSSERSVPEMLSLLYAIQHKCGSAVRISDENAGVSSTELIVKRVMDRVAAGNFKRNLGEIAAEMRLDRSTIYRAFKTSGNTPRNFIQTSRINRARELLLYSSISISELAEYLGFNDVHYFTNWFKKIMKLPPDRWRRDKQMKK